MTIYNTTEARKKFFQLIDDANEKHEPIYIKGRKHNAVLISEEDYESIQETIHIYSVPGWVDRILEARKEPLSECVEWTDDL